MRFQFDRAKSEANAVKHGIDFVQAQALWNDPYRLEIPARDLGEPRFLIIGMIKDKHWSAIVTYRDDQIRLISIRRSRDEEIKLYETL